MSCCFFIDIFTNNNVIVFHYSISVERSDRLFTEVERSAKRLEQLAEKRKEKLKELLRIKALEEETNQVSSI